MWVNDLDETVCSVHSGIVPRYCREGSLSTSPRYGPESGYDPFDGLFKGYPSSLSGDGEHGGSADGMYLNLTYIRHEFLFLVLLAEIEGTVELRRLV